MRRQLSIEEVVDERGHRVELILEREMPGVEQVDLGVGGADKPVDLMAGLWAMGRGEL